MCGLPEGMSAFDAGQLHAGSSLLGLLETDQSNKQAHGDQLFQKLKSSAKSGEFGSYVYEPSEYCGRRISGEQERERELIGIFDSLA